MKYAAIFMAVLVALALALGGYALVNARLDVVSVTAEVTPAFERQQEFTALQTAMDQDALLGIPYAEELPGSSMDYNFITFTFRLENPGMIDAEMVEITPVPLSGDRLSYATLDAAQVNANHIVPAHGAADFWRVVVTDAGTDDAPQRSFRVTYYLWGMKKSVTAYYNR